MIEPENGPYNVITSLAIGFYGKFNKNFLLVVLNLNEYSYWNNLYSKDSLSKIPEL